MRIGNKTTGIRTEKDESSREEEKNEEIGRE